MNYYNNQLVINVSNEFIITKVLFSTYNDLNITTGSSFVSIFDESSHHVYFDMIKDLSTKNLYLGEKVFLKNKTDGFIFTIRNEDYFNILIIGFDTITTDLFEDIMKLNNEHINTIRLLYKKLSSEEDSKIMFEEVMKLNSELINTRREIALKNKALNRLNLELEHINFTDYLTKINNRRKFFFDVYKFVKEADYKLIMMDFNNFKLINDKFGHIKGDETLIYFSSTLNSIVEEFDGHVYRLGGDEFAVLVKDDIEISFAEMLIPINDYLKEIHPSIAIAHGQTLLTSKNCNEEYKVELSMKLADQQMYSMKTQSKEV